MGLDLQVAKRTRTISRGLADQIRAMVRDGRLLPGEDLPSVRELARQLGVNHQTVLKALEPLKAEGLIESAMGSGTRVRGIRAAPEILVVFDLASFAQPLSPGYQAFFARINERPMLPSVRLGAGRTAGPVRLTPLLAPAEGRDEDFLGSPLLARLEAGPGDRPLGLLFVGYAASPRMQRHLEARGVPFAGVGSVGQYPLQSQHPFAEFVRRGLHYAASGGLTRVGFLYPAVPAGVPDRLRAAFEAAARAAGRTVRPEWIVGAMPVDEAAGREYLRRLAAADPASRPQLVLAADDVMASGLAREARARALSIPGDLELVATWNRRFAPDLPFDFPKAVVDADALFDKALQLLLDVLAGRRTRPRTVYAPLEWRDRAAASSPQPNQPKKPL